MIHWLAIGWYRWRLARVVRRMLRAEAELLRLGDRINELEHASLPSPKRCACGQLDSPNHRVTCWQAPR